jgi:hypothetical protein
MLPKARLVGYLLPPLWLLASAAPVLAADDKSPPADSDNPDSKKPGAKTEVVVASTQDDQDPFEDPSKTYRFIGLRYRDAVAPAFIEHWFANGGSNTNIPMVGPEFISRKDHLEIAIALMYADYGMTPTLFQSKTDPTTSWELIQSSLKLGYAMVDIMYEIPIEKKGDKTGRWAFLVGGGVGIAGVFGSLYRSQAYPNTPAAATNPGNPSLWSACTGPGAQNLKVLPMNQSGSYCDTRSNHYAGTGGVVSNGYTENSWANGGSKPLIFPWISLPQFAFRYKPIKSFQAKADFGFSTSGFWFGLSASYGLPTSS